MQLLVKTIHVGEELFFPPQALEAFESKQGVGCLSFMRVRIIQVVLSALLIMIFKIPKKALNFGADITTQR